MTEQREGHRATPTEARANGSGAMFDAIADRYDLLNGVMSAGIDRTWRRATVSALEIAPGQRVLDVATGTGALAFELARHGASVTGIDPSSRMLELAARKLDGRPADVRFMPGYAEALPFSDGEFDAACIAFGIRNASDRGRALCEMVRVVRAGGRIAVLELSQPTTAPARLWVRHVLPRIGALLSGRAAYQYLSDSIAAFPPPEEFAAAMALAGIADVRAQRLTLGACVLFCGRRA
jgi:demethylmenaquinone methyltransferase/2-methoxy-6-polyprenyl-1,4-benzoquinol methylase